MRTASANCRPPKTRAAIQAAIERDEVEPAKAVREVRVLAGDEPATFDAPGEVHLEDGTTLAVATGKPVRLPLGYHDFLPGNGTEPVRVIVAPHTCPSPPQLRGWGWAVQLFAARSTQSWGIGDLGDLRTLAGWSRNLCRGIARQPVDGGRTATSAAAQSLLSVEPSLSQSALSPHRGDRWANEAEVDLTTLAVQGRALNAQRIIDRDAVFRLKYVAFERLSGRFAADRTLRRLLPRGQGESLAEFATYCAMVENSDGDASVDQHIAVQTPRELCALPPSMPTACVFAGGSMADRCAARRRPANEVAVIEADRLRSRGCRRLGLARRIARASVLAHARSL